MKLLERIFNQDDKPVRVGSALAFERPTWLVTCVFKRHEIFGKVFTEATYEVAARTGESARESVRSYVLRTHPEDCIESLHAVRQ
ncbi:hypothetical protein [Prosthecobacter sp.]|uniref:hypothetical protein n=1 Tax=Prosthecobacter sp. TaxID=1965333 RepID=UPI003782EEF9